MAGKYVVSTLGCKVNQYESQQIRELLEELGFEPVRDGQSPDLAVVNTCAVTNSASSKSRQALRRMARNGRTHVLAVGCAATDDPERLRALSGISEVFGHDVDTLDNIKAYVAKAFGTTQPTNPNSGLSHRPAGASAIAPGTDQILPRSMPLVKSNTALTERIDDFRGHQRAFLKVQDGCDAWCTYCIIPRLRPQPRSKPIEVAVQEARALVRSGHKEIVVTGIFLGAYGQDTAIRKRFAQPRSALARLVEALAVVPGLERLRLSSLEPGDVDDELIHVLAAHPVCVPHLHLPLQSGSPEILRRMNRQYGRGDFLEMIDRVRAGLCEPAISTDIIVGFPGETEQEFQETAEVAKDVGFLKIHAFPFSPRQRTAAARWTSEFVDSRIVRARMKQLAEIEQVSSLAFRRKLLGRVERIMVERVVEPWDTATPRICSGRADRYFEVHIECGDTKVGDIVRVRLDRVTPSRTHGTRIDAVDGSYPLPILEVCHG